MNNLLTQEGGGEAIYEIGVKDCGDLEGLVDEELEESLKTLRRMADKLGASIHVLREHETTLPAAAATSASSASSFNVRKSVTCDSYLSTGGVANPGDLDAALGNTPIASTTTTATNAGLHSHHTVIQNNQESRRKYWATRLSIRSYCSLICSLRSARFAWRSAALFRLLACSLRSLLSS